MENFSPFFNCFRSSLAETSKVEVAGWGATTKFGREPADVLQFLSVNVTDFNTCKVASTQLYRSNPESF